METKEQSDAKPPKKTRRKLWALAITFIALAAFALGILGAQLFGRPGITVPESISQKVSFPIYLPERLPGNFALVKDSFSFRDGTLICAARDSSGASVSFAEQKRDQAFDFTGFHNSQIKDAKTLSGVPFPSVTGKAMIGQAKVLSVITDDTWIFVSSLAPLSQDDMRLIAASLQIAD